MELVASAKMRKASTIALRTRPYADHAWSMLLTAARAARHHQHPLLRHVETPKRVAVILIASNRGLVGGFNAQLTAAVAAYAKQLKSATLAEVETIIMGSKGRAMFYQHGHEIAAEFIKEDVIFEAIEVRPMAKLVIDGFISGQYDRVVVGFMQYVSPIIQRPTIRQVLPLAPEDFAAGQTGVVESGERQHIVQDEATETKLHEYLFEPNADRLLDALLPRLVEMQIFRAVLETNASEHAARMVAMRNAADAANDLMNELTLSFNQARQAAITQDLSEISAGRAALES